MASDSPPVRILPGADRWQPSRTAWSHLPNVLSVPPKQCGPTVTPSYVYATPVIWFCAPRLIFANSSLLAAIAKGSHPPSLDTAWDTQGLASLESLPQGIDIEFLHLQHGFHRPFGFFAVFVQQHIVHYGGHDLPR